MAAVNGTTDRHSYADFEGQQFGEELVAALDQLEHLAIEHIDQKNHPNLIECLLRVGLTYYDYGYYKHALKQFADALEMATSYYKTLSSCYLLGGIHTHIANASYKLCRYELASKHYASALAIKKTMYSPDTVNIQLAEIYKSLGTTNLETGEYDKAHENNFFALSMFKSVHGCRGHPDVAEAYTDIADVFVGQGEFTQGLEYYNRSLQATKEWLGNDVGDHIDIAKCYLKLASMYLRQTKYEKATDMAEKSLQMYKAIYGEKSRHPVIARCFKVLGDVHHQCNRYENALSQYKVAYFKLCDFTDKDAFAVKPRCFAEVCTAMAAVYTSLSRYTEAKIYDRKALSMFKTYGPGGCHPTLASTCRQAADIEQKVNGNNSEEALSMYLKSLQMYKDMYGESSPRLELVGILADVGEAYGSQCNVNQSLYFYLKSLKILSIICKYRGEKSLTLAYLCDTIAGLYQQAGNNTEAMHYYLRALEFKEKCGAGNFIKQCCPLMIKKVELRKISFLSRQRMIFLVQCV